MTKRQRTKRTKKTNGTKKSKKATTAVRPRMTTKKKTAASTSPQAGLTGAMASPPGAGPSFAGFDTGSYPGDHAINGWATDSPYSFVGFYFDAPCHSAATFKSWSGKFPLIKASGLGVIIVYVGLQQNGCGHALLSRAQGIAHGLDTVGKFKKEGFRNGSVVFLDVESFNGPLSGPMQDYIRGWVSSLLDDGTITPGIYCPAAKANDIRLAAEQEFADHGLPSGAPVFWIVKTASGFSIATSVPGDCGVSFASAWQGRLDISETHGGVTIQIDQSVADTRDPSRAT